MTATREEMVGMLWRSRRLALKLGAKAHRRLVEARAAGAGGGDRVALRLLETALTFSARAAALVQLLREQGAAS